MTFDEVIIIAIVTIGCALCAFTGYVWGRRDSWVDSPEGALLNMALMRGMLLAQLESGEIESVVRVTKKQ